MSVFQPDAASGPRIASPQPAFKVARRGYDPQEVDAYVAELIARLEEAGARADLAERAKVKIEAEMASLKEQPPTFERLGVDMAEVLEQAGRSAELLVEKAQARAATIVKEAEERAAELVKSAEGKAAELDQTARQRLADVRAETEQVREFRDGLAHHLSRVRADIDALLQRIGEQGAALGPVAAVATPAAPANAVAQAEGAAEAAAEAEAVTPEARPEADGDGAAPATPRNAGRPPVERRGPGQPT
jgi:DivIVA domain-containing protein